jgi:hypothetical protein
MPSWIISCQVICVPMWKQPVRIADALHVRRIAVGHGVVVLEALERRGGFHDDRHVDTALAARNGFQLGAHGGQKRTLLDVLVGRGALLPIEVERGVDDGFGLSQSQRHRSFPFGELPRTSEGHHRRLNG